MEITTNKLTKLGFKRYYRDEVYRLKIKNNVLNKPMYLTMVNFYDSWTWFINPFEQFTGLKKLQTLKTIIKLVNYEQE